MENIEEQRDILGLPPYVFPAAMLVFGYPTEQQIQRPKPKRVDMNYIVHENSYHELSAEELEDMFSSRAGAKGYNAWIRLLGSRLIGSGLPFGQREHRAVPKGNPPV